MGKGMRYCSSVPENRNKTVNSDNKRLPDREFDMDEKGENAALQIKTDGINLSCSHHHTHRKSDISAAASLYLHYCLEENTAPQAGCLF